MKSFIRWQFLWCAVVLSAAFSAQAQSGAFTYQGRLTDSMQAGGSYLLKLELYDAATDGTLIDTLTDVPATVANGVFTVELNFAAANAFNGAERFLQISVRRNASESYVTLAPRQRITAAPYAVRALTADNALQLDGTPASQIIREGDTRLTDSRTPRAGSANYIQNQNLVVQPSANFRINGNGAANVFTASFFNAADDYRIGGIRILRTVGDNSFFGAGAGVSNTTGNLNVSVGRNAGLDNQTGNDNAFFGAEAGFANLAGGGNTFLGRAAGFNATGNRNTFVGLSAAVAVTVGNDNSTLGANTVVGNNLAFATAIGAGATVSTSNTIVLGRSADTVQIPGALNITGAFGANVINTATQYNIGGNRVFFTPAANTFVGFNAARDNTTGDRNAFFGSFAGTSNTTGGDNSFFGREAGNRNLNGNGNSFFGFAAGFFNNANYNSFFGEASGYTNTDGIENAFFGRQSGFNSNGNRNTFFGTAAGFNNTSGSSNTAIGFNADTGSSLTNATAIGANASVSASNSLVLGSNANVGIGTSSPDAKLQVNGGDIYVGSIGQGVILRSPNGGCFRLIVNNVGALATQAVFCP